MISANGSTSIHSLASLRGLAYHNGKLELWPDSCGVQYCSVFFLDKMYFDLNTGSADINSLIEEPRVYPNPSGGYLSLERKTSEPASVMIHNLGGALVMQTSIAELISTIDLRALPPGMYFLSVGSQRLKFVRQ